MSYVVEIIRPIRKDEILAIANEDGELTIIDEGENWIRLSWARGKETAEFSFQKSRITVTTPRDLIWEKAEALAECLQAEVIGEEDDLAPPQGLLLKPGVFAGRSTWIGWPVLVIVLIMLLVWRW